MPSGSDTNMAEAPNTSRAITVQFTQQQYSVLERAAVLKGWTVPTLMMRASVERAAFIANTSSSNRIGFDALAEEVAYALFSPRQISGSSGLKEEPILVASLDDWPLDVPKERAACEITPWHKSPAFLAELREAARLGGTEFLSLIVEMSRRLTTEGRPVLSNPVDPSAL